MANHHVATLSADDYNDVESVVDHLRGALEKRFGVPTMVEARYPYWSVSADLSSRDPAPATVAAWAKDWLFDLDPSRAVSRGLSVPRSRSKDLAVNKSNTQLEREIKLAMGGHRKIDRGRT